jgi:hypothetical protein
VPSSPEQAERPQKKGSFPVYAKVFALVAWLIVIGLLAYLFWPRENWERDNAQKLVAMKAEAETSRVKGDYERSLAKCDEITTFIGTRTLEDISLRAILDYARTNKEASTKKLASKVTSQRIKLKGSAWLTKQSGDSTVLRGLSIYVIKERLGNDPSIWQSCKASLEQCLERELAMVKGEEESGWRTGAPVLRKTLELDEKGIVTIRTMLDHLKGEEYTHTGISTDLACRTIRILNSLMADGSVKSPARSVREDALWKKIMPSGVVGSTHTDASGAYEIICEVDGPCFVYAMTETSVQVIEWLVPVDGRGEVKVDLFNDNTRGTYSRELSHYPGKLDER